MNFHWRFDKRMRRAVFLAVHLAASALLAGLAVLPIHEFFAEREGRIAEQRTLLARLRGIASQEANVQAMAHQVDVEAQQGEFIVGSGDGLVNAELQTRLKSFSESAGAHIRSAQSLPPKTVEQVKYSGSRIDIYGSIQAVRKAIHAIESAKPYLFVAGADMKLALPTGRPGAAEEPVIQVQLDVFAPMQIK
jgi:general secretion pathway protein M